MGELIDFTEYLKAKRQGISVKDYRAAKRQLDKALGEIGSTVKPAEPAPEYYFVKQIEYEEHKNWLPNYPYVLIEDMETGYYDDCEHEEWHVVEEDFQATCNYCDLNTWSAPW